MAFTYPARAALAIFGLLATCSVVAGQTPQIQIVAGSVRNQSHALLKDGRQSELESRSFQVRAIDSREHIAVYEVVMFRDPSSGLFVSQIELLQRHGTYARPGDLLANTVVGVEGAAIRAFSYIRYTLSVRESTTRFSSMDEGETRVVAELSRFLRSVEWPDAGRFGSDVEYRNRLWTRLPVSLTGYSDESMHPPTRLHDLTYTNRCWGMVLDGPEGSSTPITVDQRFDLSTTARCRQPPQNRQNVRLVAGSALTESVPASRNGKPTTISIHYVEAEVTYPDDEVERLQLFMLYDPDSRLFWWAFHRMQADSSRQERALLFRDRVVYLAEEKIAVFSTDLSTASVRDSGERYPSFEAGENQVLRLLERMRGRIQLGEAALLYHRLDWRREVPRDLFFLCGNAWQPGPRLSRLTRNNRLWELTLEGQHGNSNSATVYLNDDYETLGARLSPPVPPAAIDRVVRSATVPVGRNDVVGNLEMRELQISHPSYCLSRASTRVMMLYDSANHLTWWTRLAADEPFSAGVFETEDKIVVFSGVVPRLEVRESAARYESIDEAQAHITKQLWLGNDTSYFAIDLAKDLQPGPPVQSGTPAPAVAPQVSRTNNLWQIVVPRANGEAALVVLDEGYKLISAALQR